MRVFFDARQKSHDPQFYLVRGRVVRCAEQPERADRLLAALGGRGDSVEEPTDFGPGPLAAVHSPDYLHFLATAYDRWRRLEDAGPEIVPNVHPNRHGLTYPQHIVGQAGWHQADTSCAIGPATWESARAAANTAVAAAARVADQGDAAYALCRPPGHHAFADMAGGFCFLNNTAIAAQFLRGHANRVAIVDVDVHAGNGTEGIFYDRADVLAVSLHADPDTLYPFYWGHAQERGAGAGIGYTLNLPLPPGTGDAAFLAALETACGAVAAFDPGFVVVALGLDAADSDPLGTLALTADGFRAVGARLARLALPTVLVQEGGYLSDDLGRNLVAFLSGYEGNI